ncbi:MULTISPECIES: hypothetical protein [unclassified Mycobacterium]|uniref:hypothetical protein n=1 Tax=unclassified Mycobacterium TaxID=2642494 RepID=UPI0029C73FD5|nr:MULTISPECIES: hypothetical protein [unclassified Mycobacterium]
MKGVVALSVCLIVAVEVGLLLVPERGAALLAAAGVAALALLTARWVLAREERQGTDESTARDPSESLRRWLARTETLVARSETTRSDWDKHLRPMLARQFELATGQRKSKDPRAFQVTARMVFGDELWVWVDPDNVSRTGLDEPGPGRRVLDDVLQRLERI